MFKISTYFIKGQIPHVAKSDLIDCYKKELQRQSVNNISVNIDTICFSNNTSKFVLNKFANKFSSFSQGKIKIVDEGDEFGVYFQANSSGIFSSAGLIAGVGALLIAFSAGFNIIPLITGVVIFILMIAIGFISTKVSFPIYFTGLRNDIERELQTKE